MHAFFKWGAQPNALGFALRLIAAFCISWKTASSLTTFQKAYTVTSSLAVPRRVVAFDLDGDDDMDLVSLDLTNKVVWYENLGMGNFSLGTSLVFPTKAVSIGGGDLDGDGDVDLAVGGREEDEEGTIIDSHITFFNNLDGQGNFDTGTNVTAPELDVVDSIRPVDVDGDGDLDLLVGDDNQLVVVHNDGFGGFLSSEVLASGDKIWFTEVGDVDEDGMLDIIYVDDLRSSIFWIGGDGEGSFKSPESITGTLVGEPQGLAAADFDGDGTLDVAVSTTGTSLNSVTLYANTDGLGRAWVDNEIMSSGTMYFSRLRVADLDKDGDADLLFSDPVLDTVAWFENNGNGLFGDNNIVTVLQDGPWGFDVADLDGDDDLDVVVASQWDNEVTWYKNLLIVDENQPPGVSPSPTPGPGTGGSGEPDPSPVGPDVTLIAGLAGGAVAIFLGIVAVCFVCRRREAQPPPHLRYPPPMPPSLVSHISPPATPGVKDQEPRHRIAAAPSYDEVFGSTPAGGIPASTVRGSVFHTVGGRHKEKSEKPPSYRTSLSMG